MILGINMEALVDTGSNVKLGSNNTYITLGRPKLHENDLTLPGISGNQVTPIGFITVNIEMDNYVVNTDLYIVKILNHDIILGNNVLKQLNFNISEKGLQVTGKRKMKEIRVNYVAAFAQETANPKINVSAPPHPGFTRHCGRQCKIFSRLKKLFRTLIS